MEDYFKTYGLIKHQIDSFNRFGNKDLKNIINNEPPIRYETGEQLYTLKFSNILLESPTIIDNDRTIRPLYPIEARDKNLNYSGNVCVDVIETVQYVGKIPQITEHYRVPIAKIPIMLMSDFCNLRRHTLEENETLNYHPKSDQGGYFLINGKERILISQARKAYNKPLCFLKSSTAQKEKMLICEMRSMCDETFHSTSVQVKSLKNKIVVSLKLKRNLVDVPVGVIFKSLGYDPNSDDGKFDSLFDLPSKYNKYLVSIRSDHLSAGECFYYKNSSDSEDEEEEDEALVKVFLNTSVSKDKDDNITIDDVNQSLDMDLFPHLGITSTKKQRVELLALMVKKYLKTLEKDMELDNKDDYTNKRVESAGELINYLFKLLYKKFQKFTAFQFKNRKPDISSFHRTSNITTSVAYCFATGSWGAHRNAYIRTGVCQVINPKVASIPHYSSLRRLVMPESKDGKETKTSETRQIHSSSFFLVCPVETPEGKGVGTILNMAIFCDITAGIPTCEMMDHVKQFEDVVLCKCPVKDKNNCLLIVINGAPFEIGHVDTIEKINFLNDTNISITVNIDLNIIEIFTDSGRLIRPVFDLKKISTFNGAINPSFTFLVDNQLVRYIDCAQAQKHNTAIEPADLSNNPNTSYDMMELHPCGIFGIVAGIIPFSDRTQSARNCFYTSMVKQAIGYIPGHTLKTETVSHTLNYPQKPLVTTDIANFSTLNDNPNGINAIVAIACYTGYNQEDSVILNKSSIERGLFGTSTFTTHTATEKKNGLVEEKIETPPDSVKSRDNNYGLLDETGVVRQRQRVVKGDVLIGKTTTKNKNTPKKSTDNSVVVQQGEEGCVDRVIDVTVDGCRIVKVVVTQLCVPEIGDKFCSGMAQKGTCGMIYPQEDMPFTASGMTPDIIINPNCIPSRMTINQIIATVMGKLHCINPVSKFTKGNPFMEKSTTILNDLCDELVKEGFDYSGVEPMYCGLTGRRIESKIFIGPTYYHRLKHMVKDKMHARSHGNLTTLNRQPNCGRAQGGGLRFGEMEKDCVLVHGSTKFLNERMFLCSDVFQVHVCSRCKSISTTPTSCHGCRSTDIKLCNMPYSFKNLLQELNSVGIKILIET
jgi:DNA-directed RNA polymerase II subunit RPB2